MNSIADKTQGGFEVAVGGFEGVGVDGEWCAENDERSAVAWAFDGLF